MKVDDILPIKDVWVGSVVALLTDGGESATLVSHTAEHPNSMTMSLVGWQQDPGAIGWEAGLETASVQRALAAYKMTYGWWVSPEHKVKIVSLATSSSQVAAAVPTGGMQCANRYCRAFNAYAEPNTPDGKYICYSCRQGGHTRAY